MAQQKGIGFDSANLKNKISAAGDDVLYNGSVIVDENLTVNGTTITNKTETVLIEDNYIDMNYGYTTAAAKQGGLTVNYLPTSTTSNVAGSAFSSTSVVNVVSGTGFATGNIIQIKDASNAQNNGLYEVASVAVNAITIDTTPTEKFTKNVFVADGTAVGNVTKINVAVIQTSAAGDWQVGKGNAAGITYTDLSTGTGNSLQQAYDAATPTITTDASGPITFSITSTNAAGFEVLGQADGTGAVILGNASNSVASIAADVTTTFDLNAGGAITVDSSGAAIQIGNENHSGNVDVGTNGARTISVGSSAATAANVTGTAVTITSVNALDLTDGTATLQLAGTGATSVAGATTLDLDCTGNMALNSSGGTIGIGNDAVAQDINIGTGTAARTVTVGNTTGASQVIVKTGSEGFAVGKDIILKNTITVAAGDLLSVEKHASNNNPVVYLATAAADATAPYTYAVIGCATSGQTGNGTDPHLVQLAAGSAVTSLRHVNGAGADTNVTSADIGKYVYLSNTTAGRCSTTAPSTAGTFVFQIGVVIAPTNPVSANCDVLLQPAFVMEN